MKSDHLLAWLADRPLISRHMLCEMVGYNSANLANAITGKRRLPKKHAIAMAKVLSQYGYKPTEN